MYNCFIFNLLPTLSNFRFITLLALYSFNFEIIYLKQVKMCVILVLNLVYDGLYIFFFINYSLFLPFVFCF